jgi:hypothetical protein
VIPILVILAVAVLLGGGGLLVNNLLKRTPTPTKAPIAQVTFTPTPTDTLIPTPSFTPTPGITPPADTPPPTFTSTLIPEITPPTPEPTATDTPMPPPPPPSRPTPYGVIAYAAFDEEVGIYNIYLRTWPELNVTQTIPKAGQPAVQRNGRKLAFRSWDTGRQGILIMDLQSQNVSEATNILEAMHPAWSPSESLVFTANNTPDRKWHLYVNGQMVPIDGSLEGPAWLDNNRLAFHGCVAEGCGLFIANADGSGLHRLTTSNRDLNPAPSPAGDRLAFMSDRDGNWDIYLLAADGSQATPTRLTTSPAVDALPAWSPDAHWIAFVSDRGGRWAVWMVPAAGGEPQHLFDMEGSPNGFVIDGPPSQTGWLQEQVSWFQ